MITFYQSIRILAFSSHFLGSLTSPAIYHKPAAAEDKIDPRLANTPWPCLRRFLHGDVCGASEHLAL